MLRDKTPLLFVEKPLIFKLEISFEIYASKDARHYSQVINENADTKVIEMWCLILQKLTKV